MSKFLTFKDIDHKKIIETYSLYISKEKLPECSEISDKKVTKITELKEEDSLIFMDDSKNIKNCNITMLDYLRKEKLPEKTDLNCFWCRNSFESFPIGCPIKYFPSQYEKRYYSEITKDRYIIRNNITKEKREELEEKNQKNINYKEYYETDGIFCSFNCCISFIDENKRESHYQTSESLLIKIYQEIFEKIPDFIQRAPHWRLLKEYGGTMSISEFRNQAVNISHENIAKIREIPKFKPIGWVFEKVQDKNVL